MSAELRVHGARANDLFRRYIIVSFVILTFVYYIFLFHGRRRRRRFIFYLFI